MSCQVGFKYLASLGVDTSGIIKTYTSRKLNQVPVKSFDGNAYDIIKELLKKNPRVAKQVKKAIKDKRITKKFCDVSKLEAQVKRFVDEEHKAESLQGYENYEAALQILRMMLPKPQANLQPLDISQGVDVSKIFSNPEASSGILAYPKHKEEVAPLIQRVALHIMETYDKKFSLPAIALTRSQITDFMDENGNIDSSNINHKTRLVMCVDAASVLVEQCFGQPILDNVFKGMNQYAGGKNDGQVNSFLLNVCQGKKWVSLDYSKFDAYVQAWLIADIFKILSEYYPAKYKPAFEWMMNNFINMQIIMPDGNMYNLHRGIKSGSYWTQMIGSLANLVMILTYLVKKFAKKREDGSLDLTPVLKQLEAINDKRPSNYTMVAMGDDNIFFTYDEIDVIELASYLKENFKAEITIDGEKGYERGEPHDYPSFLKRTWTHRGQTREDVEMWVNLLHPERRRSYEGYNPYHILYGYFLTFYGTMRNYITLEEIIAGMKKSGAGVDALLYIKLNDLPGSLRSQILNRGVDRALLVKSLKNAA